MGRGLHFGLGFRLVLLEMLLRGGFLPRHDYNHKEGEMHELTEKISPVNSGSVYLAAVDKIIRGWLEDKVGEIFAHLQVNGYRRSDLKEILCLTEKTLEEKFAKAVLGNIPNTDSVYFTSIQSILMEKIKPLAQIAKEHYERGEQ